MEFADKIYCFNRKFLFILYFLINQNKSFSESIS